MTRAELVFGTAGVNPVQHCLDCATVDGELVVVHGAAHQLVFRVPRVSRAFAALPVPDAAPARVRVNCVRFLDAHHVLCGTSDGRVLLAAADSDAHRDAHAHADSAAVCGGPWRCVAARDLAGVLPACAPHERSVLCIAVSTRCSAAGAPRVVVAAATASACAAVWDLAPREAGTAWLAARAPAVLRLPPQRRGLLETCAACVVGPGTRLVALGGTDCRVHLYAARAAPQASTEDAEKEKGEYTLVASLSGHQQWVSALAFAPPSEEGDDDDDDDSRSDNNNNNTILASGSHDGKMRLWRIRVNAGSEKESEKVEVELDSVLGGHDDWVTSIKWVGRGCVVTASMDRTLSVWLPERTTDVWAPAVRLWGVPGALLGGGVYGLYAVAVAPDGATVLAHGHTGAVHAWTLSPALGSRAARTAAHPPAATQCALLPAGPTARAPTLAWSDVRAHGAPPYLLVGAEDKVVRAYAACVRGTGCSSSSSSSGAMWAEIARPLVHGHAVRALCPVAHRHAVAVVAEEKAVRVLTAPSTFVKSLYLLCAAGSTAAAAAADGDAAALIPPEVLADCAARPVGAALPALSLSNRPMYDDDEDDEGSAGASAAAGAGAGGGGGEDETNEDDYGADVPSHPVVLRAAPLEEHLVKNTLWPETRKLFGHRAEALCVAAPVHAPETATAAAEEAPFVSGCGAFRPGDASVCVWRGGSAVPAPLVHATRGAVHALCCAPDGALFAAAAVDTLAVWRVGDSAAACARVAALARLFAAPPACCCWSPGGAYIAATGAPGGAAHIVRLGTQADGTPLLAPYGTVPPSTPGSSATALAWTQRGSSSSDDGLVLAVGDSRGGIALWAVGAPSMHAQAHTARLGSVPAHSAQVNALDWLAPRAGTPGPHLLASCGDDWCVHVVQVDFDT